MYDIFNSAPRFLGSQRRERRFPGSAFGLGSVDPSRPVTEQLPRQMARFGVTEIMTGRKRRFCIVPKRIVRTRLLRVGASIDAIFAIFFLNGALAIDAYPRRSGADARRSQLTVASLVLLLALDPLF